MASWESLFEGLKGDLAAGVKGEVAGLLSWAKSDSDDFIKEQGLKIENYLNQLARAEISKGQLDGYLRDIVRLTRMHELKMQVAEKASAQRLIEGITNHVLDRMLKLL
jgi:hypothetical protein